MKIFANILSWAGLLTGVAALALQFSITLPASTAAGRSLPASILFFFSYFTILSNTAAVVCHAAHALPFRSLAPLRRRSVAGAVVSAMMVVGIVYHFLLAGIWAPQGLFLLCDRLLHYVTPAIAVLWWAVTARGETRFKDIAGWVAWPAGYLVFVYIRWLFVAEVPYYFLDPKANALQDIALVCIGIFILFLTTSAAAVSLDKWLRRTTERETR